MLDLRTNLPSRANNVADLVIAKAYRDLAFNRADADTFGAWFISKTPTGKTIQDETPGRKARTELATTGSVFDGTNYFEKTDIANADVGTDDTSFTVRVVFSGNGSSADGDHIISTYDTVPAEGCRVALRSGFLEFSLIDGAGTARQVSSTISAADIQAGGIYEAVGVYDSVADTVSIYVDGEFHASNSAPSYTALTQNIVRIGARSDTVTGTWFGNIFEAQIWNDQALTAAEIVKLRDKKISYFQGDKAPSVAWLLDGPTCVDLIGDNDLTPVADPSAYSGSEGSTWLNDQGWTDYENLVLYSDDLGNGWSGGTKSGNTVTLTGTDRVSSSGGPVNTAGIFTWTVKFSASDSGKPIALTLWNGSQWLISEDLTIDDEGFATAEFDSLGGTIRNRGFRRATVSPDPLTLDFEYAHLRYSANNSTYIKTESSQVDYAIRPKRWNADLDSDGYAGDANSFGPVKRNREYRNGPSIDLNGVDQYGVKPNSIDWSNKDFIFRIRVQPDAVGADYRIFTQDDTTTNIWLSLKSTGEWATHQDGAWRTWNGIANPIAGKSYLVEIAKVGTSHTITVTNLTDGLAPESQTLVFGRGSTTGDFLIGCNRTATNNHFDGKIWGIEIEHASGIKTPVSEEVGIVSHDTLNPESPIAWQGDPTWDFTANDSYFHGETVGYSAVPIFANGVQLRQSTEVDFDGIKTTEVEVDFVPRAGTIGGYLFVVAGDAPIRFSIGADGDVLQVWTRDTSDVIGIKSSFVLTPNQIHKLIVEITEDETHPATQSSVVIRDRITGEVLQTDSAKDIGISTAAINSGKPQIGNRTNGGNPCNGEVYRVRQVIGGVETLLWTADQYLINQADNVAMTETGGTHSVKKIPAASKALDTNGYPTTNPAGPYHNRTAAEMTETPVANSDSVNPTYYGASFDGTLDANINADTNVTAFPFILSCDVTTRSAASGENFLYLSAGASEYFGFRQSTGQGLYVQRREDGQSVEQKDTTFNLVIGQTHSISCTFISETSFSITFDGTTILYEDENPVSITSPFGSGHLYIGQFRASMGSTPEFDIKNVIVKQGSTIVNDLPLYKDALGREAGDDPKHGTLSATGVSFLSNAMESDLSPDIAEHENRAVESGDRKIISIGAR